MHPVLEIYAPDGFTLWPVAETERFGYLPLSGALDPAEVGTAVMTIANTNNTDPHEDHHPPRPADPVGSFLYGLLTMEYLIVSGGLRVTDTASDTTMLPGCCDGLEEWRDWLGLLDGDGQVSMGHDPWPLAERLGDTVRLTIDTEQDNSPVIQFPATELRRLLTDTERDLTAFLQLTTTWAAAHLPEHATLVTAALARALALPNPVVRQKP
jgi:hypothetical protein